MSDIPTDVRFEILCRLPVKSLLKFRCVSKSWKALIDSPMFVKMHLQSSQVNPKLILCGHSRWCDVSLDIVDTPAHSESTMVTFDYPIEDEVYAAMVLGHWNGLLLVKVRGFEFVLWNPYIRKYIILPNYEFEKPTKEITDFQFYYGFGYDKVTDDYKVLRILQVYADDENLSQVVVYSLKSRSYRRTKEFPFGSLHVRAGVFVFGALHWFVLLSPEMAGKYMIVAFDVGTEEYNMVHLPLNLGIVELYQAVLGVFEGCLSLSCNYECKRVDIWLLRDPKNRDSWAKLFSLKVDDNWSFNENVKPISYSKCGKYVILEKDEEQLLCYDLELKSMRKILLVHGPSSFLTFRFTESLVLNNLGGDEVIKVIDQPEEKETTSYLLGSD